MTHHRRHLRGRLAAFGLALACCISCSGAQAQPAPQAAQLPGGANSLQESFDDWRVICATQGTVRRCTVAQEQSSAQSRQRILAIELGMNGDKLEGILVLPFGLVLDRGAALQLDDQPAQAALRFRTCLPAGCLVPISFDAKTTAALRKGGSLKVKVGLENGQDQTLPISLKGFATALDRLTALMKG